MSSTWAHHEGLREFARSDAQWLTVQEKYDIWDS